MFNIQIKEVKKNMKKKKGVPKQDGSGQGRRLNRGRGGCEETQPRGKGRRRRE
jgi:hypothetical protein